MGVKAGSGEWIFRDEDQHKCQKPGGTSKTRARDQWKCNCGITYEVASVVNKGDMRESWYEITWRAVSIPPVGDWRG